MRDIMDDKDALKYDILLLSCFLTLFVAWLLLVTDIQLSGPILGLIGWSAFGLAFGLAGEKAIPF